MKTQQLRWSKPALGLLLAGTLFAACKKETNSTPEKLRPNLSAVAREDDDELKYKNCIEAASYGLLALRNNPQFRELVNAKAAERFDGESNVLLKDLAESCAAAGIDLAAMMKADLEEQGKSDLASLVDDAVKGFAYFDKAAYLQIYIPDIDETLASDVPYIVMHKDGLEEAPAIVPESAETNILNGTTGKGKRLWVISVNERVDVNGLLPAFLTAFKGTGAQGNCNGNIFISRIKYSSDKEVSFNGGPEIAFSYNFINGTTPYYLNMVDFFYSSTTGQLEKWRDVNHAYKSRIGGSNPSAPSSPLALMTNTLAIIFFERDFAKAYDQTDRMHPQLANTAVTFGSMEGPYGHHVFRFDPGNLMNPVQIVVNDVYGLDVEYQVGDSAPTQTGTTFWPMVFPRFQ